MVRLASIWKKGQETAWDVCRKPTPSHEGILYT